MIGIYLFVNNNINNNKCLYSLALSFMFEEILLSMAITQVFLLLSSMTVLTLPPLSLSLSLSLTHKHLGFTLSVNASLSWEYESGEYDLISFSCAMR